MPASPPAAIAKGPRALPPPPAPPSPYVVLQLAASGCYPPLRALLASYPAAAACHDEHGRTPLHVAAAEGHAAVVELLLQCGADALAADARGATPLSEATRNGRIAALRVLARRDVPLPGAVSAQRLHDDLAPRRELFAAAAAGDVRAATVAASCFGAHLNAANADGRTPLHIAVDCGHTAMASYLIASGADPAMRDRWGRTASAQGAQAADPAMRALFEASLAAAAATAAAASEAPPQPPAPQRTASPLRIHRVGSGGGGGGAPRTERTERSATVHNGDAPHIVRVEPEASADSPMRSATPAEQRLLDASQTFAHHGRSVANGALMGNTRPHTPPVLADRAVNDLNMPANAGANGLHHAHSMPPSPFEKPVASRAPGFRRAQSHKTLLRSGGNTRGYEWGDDWVGGERHDPQLAPMPLLEQTSTN